MRKLHFIAAGAILITTTILSGLFCTTEQTESTGNKGQLTLFNTWQTDGIITALTASHDVQQRWLFVGISGGIPRLIALDLSDVDEPVSIGALEYPSGEDFLTVGDLSVEDTHLYASLVGPGGGLWIVNIADPTSLTHAGFIETPLGILKQVTVHKGTALLTGDFPGGLSEGPGLVTIDVSRPSSPFVTGVSFGSIAGIPGVAFGERIAYVTTPGAIYAIDPFDLQSPIGVFPLPRPPRSDYPRIIPAEQVEKGYAVYDYKEYVLLQQSMVNSDIAVSGDYAYVVSDFEGLRIIDVSNPTNMREIGILDAPGASHIHLRGDTAFIRVSNQRDATKPITIPTTLLAVDVSQPEVPRVLGDLNTEYTGAFAVAGERLYAVNGPHEILIVSYMDTE